MPSSWRDTLTHQPQWQNFSKWPCIDTRGLSASRRHAFLRNQHIVAQVLSHTPLVKVASDNHVRPSQVSRLMERCLGTTRTDEPMLTEALIPYRHVGKQCRSQGLPSFAEPSGYSGAFGQLLNELPTIQTHIDRLIRQQIKESDTAPPFSIALFFGEFQRVLAEAHWPKDRYPYTCSGIVNLATYLEVLLCISSNVR